MRRTFWCAGLGAALLLAALPVIAAAQDFMTPTKEHEAMAEDVGTWEGEASIWPTEGAEPMKSKGVETNKMLGKMWLLSEYVGDMGGEKFEGRSAFGYDPIKKKYYGGWIDTMSPFMMRLEGDYDEATNTLTMNGESVNVMTGKPEKYKLTTKWDGTDKKTFEIFGPITDESEGYKMMEIKYTRRK
jgi:hypothetical protein